MAQNHVKPKLDISVVIPLYNEEDNVDLLHKALDDVLSKMPEKYEIIFIDDGSSDNTFAKMRMLAQKDPNLKLIKFRNNCGQSAATDAGFEMARGKTIIVMDGDLQNDPRDIPK
ncbi:MAG TPA: glycosyltransferase, partial [Bacteroidetes bacterium]|nr:glycosyltransferase [Bacteroidota bacterium]